MFDQQKHSFQSEAKNQYEANLAQIKQLQETIEYGSQQYDLMETQYNNLLQKKDASHKVEMDSLLQ